MTTIIGGGIGGLALAAGLSTRGLGAAVYERADGLSDGAFLMLGGDAQEALVALGVPEDALEEASFPVDFMAFSDTEGKQYKRPSPARQYLRRDLLRALHDAAITAGATLSFGSPISHIDTNGGAVNLALADGKSAVADLVVAADGIDSQTRLQLEPHRRALYGGQIVIYGVATDIAIPTPAKTLHFHVQRRTDELPTSTFGHLHQGNGQVLWFCRITRPELSPPACGPASIETWADTILTAVPEASGLITSVLDGTANIHVTNARNVPIESAAAPSEPIILIGDADHAVSPAAGSGASDAIRDALAVTTALAEAASPALAMLERRRHLLAHRRSIAHIPSVPAS